VSSLAVTPSHWPEHGVNMPEQTTRQHGFSFLCLFLLPVDTVLRGRRLGTRTQ